MRYILPTFPYRLTLPRLLMLGVALVISTGRVYPQTVPTIQQTQFRSQWAGEQIDQIPNQSPLTVPSDALQADTGALQTPDELDREANAALSNVKKGSPFAFKPSLSTGWMVSSQGKQTVQNGQTSYGTASSAFIAPAVGFLYDREHGPWSLSAGYSVGYRYYTNPNFVANGTGSQRNPFSQTALLRAAMEMSRYIWTTLVTASGGNGYDLSAGVNNKQVTVNTDTDFKYLISSSSTIAAKAGYNFQNSSGSSVTQNNNVSGYYANLSPIYALSDKSHISGILSTGANFQNLNNVQGPNGSTLANSQSRIAYIQGMGKIKYDITGKLASEISLGARELWANNPTPTGTTGTSSYNKNLGIKPAWSAGLNYTPTTKTSMLLTVGEQGSDLVPEVNLMLTWKPRERTTLGLSVSQAESYSNLASGQYLITRGVLGTFNQQLSSRLAFMLSGGYTSQSYRNVIGGNTPSNGAAAQIPGNYYIGSAGLVWNVSRCIDISNTIYYNSGSTIQSGGNNSGLSQLWYSISVNFAL